MEVTIDNRVRIRGLSDLVSDELKVEFTYKNPDYDEALLRAKAMGYSKVGKGTPRTLTTWAEDGDELSLPRGALVRITRIVGSAMPDLLFDSHYGDEVLNRVKHFVYQGHELREFQKDLVSCGLANSTCLWRSPPGSGKTTAALAYAAALDLPTLVIVPTKSIFDQWVSRAQSDLGLAKKDIGVIGSGKRKICKLTIGMQQTLTNCASEYADTFGCIIGDEAQLFGAKTFFTVVDVFKARYRLAVTADERRADGKEFLVHDIFGPVKMEVERQVLIDEGFIIDAEIRIVPTQFRAEWYTDTPPMKRKLLANRLLDAITADDDRNQLIGEVLLRCGDEPTIILAKRREHCHTLDTLASRSDINSGLLMGGVESREEFNRTVQELNDGVLRVAIGTYQAIGVGFDIPAISRGIFAAPVANSHKGRMQFSQFCGRFERPSENKKDSIIYYLWDQHVYGPRPLHNLKRWKKNITIEIGGEVVSLTDYLKKYRLESLRKKYPQAARKFRRRRG